MPERKACPVRMGLALAMRKMARMVIESGARRPVALMVPMASMVQMEMTGMQGVTVTMAMRAVLAITGLQAIPAQRVIKARTALFSNMVTRAIREASEVRVLTAKPVVMASMAIMAITVTMAQMGVMGVTVRME